MKTLNVALPGRAYDIVIGSGLLKECGERIRAVTKAETIAVVTDSNVAPLYLQQVENSLKAVCDQLVITADTAEDSTVQSLRSVVETQDSTCRVAVSLPASANPRSTERNYYLR